MADPKIVQKKPYVMNMEAGKYAYCTCGQSKKDPFCDGSHQGSEFTPLPFNITEKKDVWLCQCKHSANKPFCNGKHREL